MRTILEVVGGLLLLWAGFEIGARWMAKFASEKMEEMERLHKQTFELLIKKLTNSSESGNN